MNENKQNKKLNTYNMRSALVNYYLLVMFTFFELFLTNQYARARTDKFLLFIILSGVLIVSTVVISLVYNFDKGIKAQGGIHTERPIFALSATDVGFFAFFIFAAITTLISPYKLDSLLGSAGRDNGLLLIFLYLCVYFIISRFYYFKNYVLCAFLVFGSIVSLLAILHFFYIDPLGVMDGYSESVVKDFGSTIGNKNLIASYMCIFLPFTLMMFVVQKKISMIITSGFALVFAYCGLLVAGSNSGYIGFFAMMFFVFAVCVRKFELLRRLMLALTVMFAGSLLLRVFSFIMNDNSKGFEAIGKTLIYSKWIFIIIAVTGALTLILYALKFKKVTITKWPKNVLTGVVLFVACALLSFCAYLFIKYSFIDTKTDIGSLSQIFRFDDRWGTHRGFFWINGMKEFFDFDFIHIMFGSGCDTFYYVFEPYFEELSIRFNNGSTNCIHSEFLNYLVTQGVLGLLSYLAILITSVYRSLKVSLKNELALIFVFPVITYAAQSVVNIYNPIVTPFLFIFIALSECLSRESNPVNRLE